MVNFSDDTLTLDQLSIVTDKISDKTYVAFAQKIQGQIRKGMHSKINKKWLKKMIKESHSVTKNNLITTTPLVAKGDSKQFRVVLNGIVEVPITLEVCPVETQIKEGHTLSTTKINNIESNYDKALKSYLVKDELIYRFIQDQDQVIELYQQITKNIKKNDLSRMYVRSRKVLLHKILANERQTQIFYQFTNTGEGSDVAEEDLLVTDSQVSHRFNQQVMLPAINEDQFSGEDDKNDQALLKKKIDVPPRSEHIQITNEKLNQEPTPVNHMENRSKMKMNSKTYAMARQESFAVEQTNQNRQLKLGQQVSASQVSFGAVNNNHQRFQSQHSQNSIDFNACAETNDRIGSYYIKLIKEQPTVHSVAQLNNPGTQKKGDRSMSPGAVKPTSIPEPNAMDTKLPQVTIKRKRIYEQHNNKIDQGNNPTHLELNSVKVPNVQHTQEQIQVYSSMVPAKQSNDHSSSNGQQRSANQVSAIPAASDILEPNTPSGYVPVNKAMPKQRGRVKQSQERQKKSNGIPQPAMRINISNGTKTPPQSNEGPTIDLNSADASPAVSPAAYERIQKEGRIYEVSSKEQPNTNTTIQEMVNELSEDSHSYRAHLQIKSDSQPAQALQENPATTSRVIEPIKQGQQVLVKSQEPNEPMNDDVQEPAEEKSPDRKEKQENRPELNGEKYAQLNASSPNGRRMDSQRSGESSVERLAQSIEGLFDLIDKRFEKSNSEAEELRSSPNRKLSKSSSRVGSKPLKLQSEINIEEDRKKSPVQKEDLRKRKVLKSKPPLCSDSPKAKLQKEQLKKPVAQYSSLPQGNSEPARQHPTDKLSEVHAAVQRLKDRNNQSDAEASERQLKAISLQQNSIKQSSQLSHIVSDDTLQTKQGNQTEVGVQKRVEVLQQVQTIKKQAASVQEENETQVRRPRSPKPLEKSRNVSQSPEYKKKADKLKKKFKFSKKSKTPIETKALQSPKKADTSKNMSSKPLVNTIKQQEKMENSKGDRVEHKEKQNKDQNNLVTSKQMEQIKTVDKEQQEIDDLKLKSLINTKQKSEVVNHSSNEVIYREKSIGKPPKQEATDRQKSLKLIQKRVSEKSMQQVKRSSEQSVVQSLAQSSCEQRSLNTELVKQYEKKYKQFHVIKPPKGDENIGTNYLRFLSNQLKVQQELVYSDSSGDTFIAEMLKNQEESNKFDVKQRINDSPFLSYENQQKYETALKNSKEIEDLEHSLEDQKQAFEDFVDEQINFNQAVEEQSPQSTKQPVKDTQNGKEVQQKSKFKRFFSRSPAKPQLSIQRQEETKQLKKELKSKRKNSLMKDGNMDTCQDIDKDDKPINNMIDDSLVVQSIPIHPTDLNDSLQYQFEFALKNKTSKHKRRPSNETEKLKQEIFQIKEEPQQIKVKIGDDCRDLDSVVTPQKTNDFIAQSLNGSQQFAYDMRVQEKVKEQTTKQQIQTPKPNEKKGFFSRFKKQKTSGEMSKNEENNHQSQNQRSRVRNNTKSPFSSQRLTKNGKIVIPEHIQAQQQQMNDQDPQIEQTQISKDKVGQTKPPRPGLKPILQKTKDQSVLNSPQQPRQLFKKKVSFDEETKPEATMLGEQQQQHQQQQIISKVDSFITSEEWSMDQKMREKMNNSTQNQQAVNSFSLSQIKEDAKLNFSNDSSKFSEENAKKLLKNLKESKSQKSIEKTHDKLKLVSSVNVIKLEPIFITQRGPKKYQKGIEQPTIALQEPQLYNSKKQDLLKIANLGSVSSLSDYYISLHTIGIDPLNSTYRQSSHVQDAQDEAHKNLIGPKQYSLALESVKEEKSPKTIQRQASEIKYPSKNEIKIEQSPLNQSQRHISDVKDHPIQIQKSEPKLKTIRSPSLENQRKQVENKAPSQRSEHSLEYGRNEQKLKRQKSNKSIKSQANIQNEKLNDAPPSVLRYIPEPKTNVVQEPQQILPEESSQESSSNYENNSPQRFQTPDRSLLSPKNVGSRMKSGEVSYSPRSPRSPSQYVPPKNWIGPKKPNAFSSKVNFEVNDNDKKNDLPISKSAKPAWNSQTRAKPIDSPNSIADRNAPLTTQVDLSPKTPVLTTKQIAMQERAKQIRKNSPPRDRSPSHHWQINSCRSPLKPYYLSTQKSKERLLNPASPKRDLRKASEEQKRNDFQPSSSRIQQRIRGNEVIGQKERPVLVEEKKAAVSGAKRDRPNLRRFKQFLSKNSGNN